VREPAYMRRSTNLEALDEVDCDRVAGLPAEVAHGDIRVQLRKPGNSHIRTGLADILFSQEEL
jgi:hypothetical protein